MTSVSELDQLRRERDAYRLVAVNAGWNHREASAYGHSEYAAYRIEEVDATAARTIASGYDAAGYLRDHSRAALANTPAQQEGGDGIL